MKKKFILLIMIIAILTVSLSACNSERNDRQYALSELIGEYKATGIAYSANEFVDYYMTISSDGSAKATRVYTNESSSRYNPIGQQSSSTQIELSGTVLLTKTDISIGRTSGYITTVNGKIVIHINNRDYIKTK